MSLIRHTSIVCPTDPDTLVAVDIGDDQLYAGKAREFSWGSGYGPEGEGRIENWALLVMAPPPCPRWKDVARLGTA